MRILATFVALLAVAFAAAPLVTSPFSGFTADQLPNPQIEPPVQPAGYAFSIWGLIYLWLVVSAVFGAIRRSDAEDWHAARPALALSLAVGVPWLAIANASAIWATAAIFVMAAGAIIALLQAPNRDRWLFAVPVGLYAGWLTAASAVSLATTMAGYGIAADAVTWAYLGITLALAVALVTSTRRPDVPEYLLAVIWALVGVAVANGAEQIGITTLAAVGILVLLLTGFRNLRTARQMDRQPT